MSCPTIINNIHTIYILLGRRKEKKEDYSQNDPTEPVYIRPLTNPTL